MDEATQRLWAERAVQAVNCAFPFVEFSTWAGCERLLPQAHACAELINQWGFESRESRLLNRAGFYLYERGRYAGAKPLLERALAIREKALGAAHPHVATWGLENYALCLRAIDRSQEAEPLQARARAIRAKSA
jgi:tetratricopeptide (TPR) repeat protein